MNPYRYAENFFSSDYLPQQVTWAVVLLLLSIVAIMAGVVLVRRAFGLPRRSSAGAPPPAGVSVFERYEIGARLWHVGLIGILGAFWISGIVFYDPGVIPSPVPVLGWPWLWVHLGFAVFFLFGILVHVIKVFRIDPGQMWFDRHDWSQLVSGTRYYLGLPHEVPKLAKYAVSSKVFHVLVALLSFLMIFTGITMTMDTMGWATMDPRFQRTQRILHDFGSWGFLALIVGHVFWQLLKRWSQAKAMVTGTIEADTFKAHHDWDLWKPDAIPKSTDKKAG
jgi:cytochrome b subunit of formate dehydrogenase